MFLVLQVHSLLSISQQYYTCIKDIFSSIIYQNFWRVNLKISISHNIRILRKKANLTQIDVAKALGVSIATLRRWEHITSLSRNILSGASERRINTLDIFEHTLYVLWISLQILLFSFHYHSGVSAGAALTQAG